MEKDPVLGSEIHHLMLASGLERVLTKTPMDNHLVKENIEQCFSAIMERLGLDITDPSLVGTPARVAKMYLEEVFEGLNYDNFPKCAVQPNDMIYDEMIAENDIDVKSMCEHHFLPFVGKASVAYIPKTKIIGLSKLNRVVNFFSRRPQVQERLTEQIAVALKHIITTQDVAVVIRADHMCVKIRGVQNNSNMVTSKLCGRFRTVPELRAEFLSLAHQ